MNENTLTTPDMIELKEFYKVLCDTKERKIQFDKLYNHEECLSMNLWKYRQHRFSTGDIDIMTFEELDGKVREHGIEGLLDSLQKMFLQYIETDRCYKMFELGYKNGWRFKTLYKAYISNLSKGRRLMYIIKHKCK